MSKTQDTFTKHISIKTLRHATTGLLVALSDDLPGLCVHGRNDDELMARMPVAIRALLEAMGNVVVSLEPTASGTKTPPGFLARSPDFDATVRHA